MVLILRDSPKITLEIVAFSLSYQSYTYKAKVLGQTHNRLRTYKFYNWLGLELMIEEEN